MSSCFIVAIMAAFFFFGCAGSPTEREAPLPSLAENIRLTETLTTEALMMDTKFQEGIDAAMATGSTLEPFVTQLSTVPPTSESRVLMDALLEEEAKRRPLKASSPAPFPLEPAAVALAPSPTNIDSARSGHTRIEDSYWTRNRVLGAILSVAVFGFVISKLDHKLVITVP